MKSIIIKILILCIWTVSNVAGGDSLLDNSQIVWSKLLNGSLSELGSLDPLVVPLVKVDQSQGHIRYRMVLNDVQITGLNESTIESVHIGRGKVKSNLSEYEAGYVSYSDTGKVNVIRYRFQTVVKEPQTPDFEELSVTPIEGSEAGGRRDFENANQRNQQQFSRIRIYADESQAPIQGGRNYQLNQRFNQNRRVYYDDSQRGQVYNRNGSPQFENLKASGSPTSDENQRPYQQSQTSHQQYQSRQRTPVTQDQPQRQYTEETRYYQRFSATPENQREYSEAARDQGQYARPQGNQQSREQQSYNQHAGVKTSRVNPSRYSGQSRRTDETDNSDCGESQFGCTNRRVQNSNFHRSNSDESENKNRENFGAEFSSGGANRARVRYGDPDGVRVRVPVDNSQRQPIAQDKNQQFSERLEEQPGFIDIIYMDTNNNHKSSNSRMRHFGNLRIESTKDTTVYSFDDAIKDLENHQRFIIHNFTEGESLLKKNDRVKLAEETQRIEDLIRYAKNYQEKEGFFEEGLEIIYRYGNNSDNSSAIESKRSKRAHEEEDEDEDIIHVVLKIRVPLMSVKAGYVLMGNVGDQVLRGDGRLDGNFTEVVGDFTIELEKTGNNSMIVRAARAKLEAADSNVELEGMDDKGPVEEILNQGLVAAEAVAAMFADDLATKALNDKTSDSIIYKLYEELRNEVGFDPKISDFCFRMEVTFSYFENTKFGANGRLLQCQWCVIFYQLPYLRLYALSLPIQSSVISSGWMSPVWLFDPRTR